VSRRMRSTFNASQFSCFFWACCTTNLKQMYVIFILRAMPLKGSRKPTAHYEKMSEKEVDVDNKADL
jgi:hypothetical protein